MLSFCYEKPHKKARNFKIPKVSIILQNTTVIKQGNEVVFAKIHEKQTSQIFGFNLVLKSSTRNKDCKF